MSAWATPQYIVACLFVLFVLIDLFCGRDSAENRLISLLGTTVMALLLIWGGFWS